MFQFLDQNISVVIAGRALLDKIERQHADIRGPLRAWRDIVRNADWSSPADLKATFSAASFLSNNRVVFNIKGNNYRLLCRIDYATRTVRVVRGGTHAEYDRWS